MTAQKAFAVYAAMKGDEKQKTDIAWWINEGGRTAAEVAVMYGKSVAVVKKIARAAVTN